MTELSGSYPEYGFAQHKGYSTRSHMRALTEHGPCPEHRASFANVMSLAQRGAEPPDGWEEEDIPAEDDLTAVPEQVVLPEQMRSGELLDGELTYG
jgi:ribonuclease HII